MGKNAGAVVSPSLLWKNEKEKALRTNKRSCFSNQSRHSEKGPSRWTPTPPNGLSGDWTEVNDELKILIRQMETAVKHTVLGRIGVITFHSLKTASSSKVSNEWPRLHLSAGTARLCAGTNQELKKLKEFIRRKRN